MARIFLAIIAIVVLSMIAVSGFQAGLENAGTNELVTNETFTPDPGNVTVLDDSQRSGAYYGESVDVYENGTEMDSGSDYKWYPGNGTVQAVVGGGLDGDTEAQITYRFQQTTAEQRSMAGLLSHIPRMMGLALPIGGLFVLLLFLRGL